MILAMDSDTFKELNVFVEKVRNKLLGVSSKIDDNVFVSWTGRKMDSSMVTANYLVFGAMLWEKK